MADFREKEYDPLTKVTYEYIYDDGKVTINTSMDVEPIKRRMYEMRKQRKYTHTGSKDFDHADVYATLETIHQLEALKDGINLGDTDALVKWVNTKHPELRATEKWHDSRKARAGKSRIIVR